MMLIRAACVIVSVLLACEAEAQVVSKKTPIAESGEAKIVARSSKFDAQVLIRTRSAEKKMETMLEPGGYVERSYVERIEIMVGGKSIFVSRSVFCNLFDLHYAQIRLGQKGGVLWLEGGDASESYWVKIEFDAELVKRKSLGSGMAPPNAEDATEVTSYRLRVLKDE
jgi:hypothetical protein